jgi:hypothetical protein
MTFKETIEQSAYLALSQFPKTFIKGYGSV